MLRKKPFFIVGIDEDSEEQFMNPEIGKKIREIGREEDRILRLRKNDTRMLGDVCQRTNYSFSVWGPRKHLLIFAARSLDVVKNYDAIVGQEQIKFIAEVDPKLIPPMRLYWDVLERAIDSMENRVFNILMEVNGFNKKHEVPTEIIERKKQEVKILEREADDLYRISLSTECRKLARKIVKLIYLQPRNER